MCCAGGRIGGPSPCSTFARTRGADEKPEGEAEGETLLNVTIKVDAETVWIFWARDCGEVDGSDDLRRGCAGEKWSPRCTSAEEDDKLCSGLGCDVD